ncbi:N-acetylneuraminate synthase [Halothermothrix orenii]|uniref:N-acetylneuraminate synthase n=1 Tax=Halothermothrix orenii (strain H 168 / OCM 544 / DSM 9562) TaxID=373903 RepID=B8CYS5_HALOH|nr:N-acetylneuraminate synthase [Halothermothrix orenii]ACL70444.1 N-acetylneuraminate synthase [Halothermothrix orenii H 168]
MGVFVIAEAGVNHNGDIKLAKELIDKAVWAGADAIKFQTFRADKLASKIARKADYQKEMVGKDESQYTMLKKLEFTVNDFRALKEYCDRKNIIFMSSPFDLESIDLLANLGMEIWKIPSGEITNLPYLRKIGHLKKKVIMSTGMSNLSEIEVALDVLKDQGVNDITVLHCNTEYPTPIEDVNLKAMQTIQNAFKVKVGYSDHTRGIEVPIAAVALGAEVIEKHFTLDRDMEGPDHKASLEPEELKIMIEFIRNIEKALGDGIKKPSKSEIKNKDIVRKSIVAAHSIRKGERFTEGNLTVKRPGNGISPMYWDQIIGKVAKRDYKKDELIEL